MAYKPAPPEGFHPVPPCGNKLKADLWLLDGITQDQAPIRTTMAPKDHMLQKPFSNIGTLDQRAQPQHIFIQPYVLCGHPSVSRKVLPPLHLQECSPILDQDVSSSANISTNRSKRLATSCNPPSHLLYIRHKCPSNRQSRTWQRRRIFGTTTPAQECEPLHRRGHPPFLLTLLSNMPCKPATRAQEGVDITQSTCKLHRRLHPLRIVHPLHAPFEHKNTGKTFPFFFTF